MAAISLRRYSLLLMGVMLAGLPSLAGAAPTFLSDVDEADESRQGALLEIERHINDNLKVGVGYNFTEFSDDLGDLDHQRNGWFINLVGKL